MTPRGNASGAVLALLIASAPAAAAAEAYRGFEVGARRARISHQTASSDGG
jgi:hypothetical protein